ncbi:dienelactone hydrolase family protein [Polymorphobacter sp. PAMC 29334]|uniref:dienelactone hydrolase family protein n=1 Tax=Polymorphobacter sp. PAMC 29334 TaxID=2862331 RepID=UPI001C677CDF|nr:dienelactone hydrolase family protein [Polymorphobacter sp. PAMC 29334]QYE34757.1 dienelactone hydrolase family protein [Polymorphobacter sp. PAMC 29334]
MTVAFDYDHAGTTCRGGIALPAGDARVPGIALFHDINGVGPHNQGWADRIAAELGYVALAADVYGEGRTPGDFNEGLKWIGELRGDIPLLNGRSGAALEALKAHPRCDGRIGAVGFCFGGAVMLELARASNPLMAAGVSMHGALQTSTKVAPGGIHAHLLICHGAEDPMIDYAALSGFLGEMRDAGADCQTIAYTGVVHAFTRPDQDGSANPALKFNEAANRRSWRAMTTHFEEVFG